jgi:hypothetical protein
MVNLRQKRDLREEVGQIEAVAELRLVDDLHSHTAISPLTAVRGTSMVRSHRTISRPNFTVEYDPSPRSSTQRYFFEKSPSAAKLS